MIWIDYIIIAILGFSTAVSVIRGFVREAWSLVIWGGAFFIAGHFYSYLSDYFTDFTDQRMRDLIAMSLLFIAVLLIGAVINYILDSLVKRTGLSGPDRIVGMCFGALRGILIVSALLLFLENFTYFSQDSAWSESRLIPEFHSIIKWLSEFLKEKFSLISPMELPVPPVSEE